jgi:hypothetical protein
VIGDLAYWLISGTGLFLALCLLRRELTRTQLRPDELATLRTIIRESQADKTLGHNTVERNDQ